MRFSLRPLLVVLGIILGLLGTLSAGHIAHAQFDPLGAGVGGVAGGDAEWADVDDDGDLDLLLIGNGSGSTDNAQPSATLYENQGDGTFSPFNAGLEGVSAGSAAFGDFNDDGHPDLIITGNQGGFSEENPPVNSAQIYENDGSGDFSHLNAGIEGVTVGCVDWADVDGDGNLDLVVAGNVGGFGIIFDPDPSIRIYEGDGDGSFTQLDAGIDEGVAAVCSSNFGDIDDDGDADLAITGGQGNLDNPEPYAAVYENDGTGTFSPVNAPITDVAGRAATWADVDDNASLDLILAGVEADSVQRTRLYLNDGNGGFSESSTSLADVAGGAIAPADVDLDGDLDLALSGRDTTGSPVAFVYENDGTGEFTPFEAGLTPVEGSAAAWGDVGVETSPDLALVGRDADSTATATIYENQLGGTAQAQFIHNAADPAADSVDVYFGNERALDDVGFRSATEFIDVPAGLDIEAGVAPAGSSGPEDIVATQPVTFGAGEAHTVVANGVLTPDEFADNPDGAPIGVEFFVESGAKTTASSGEVDLRAVHGATDAPTVDIGAVETSLFEGLTYGDVTSNYTTATAEEKLLTVTASGPDTLVAAFQADLSGLDGDAATMLASGFLDPAANQDGPAFRLIAAQPNGTVTTFPLNEAPQFTSVPADFAVAPETEIDTTIEANDPDGDELTFSATDGLPDGASIDASTGQFAWTPSLDQQDSTYTIGVQAGDGAVETDTSFAVTVEPGNIPPMVVAGPPDDSIEVTGPPLQLVNLGSAFQDPDGDSLSITATSGDPSIVSVNGSGRQIPLVPTNTGTADVTLTADDGSATASTGFSVTVLPDDGNENPSSQSLAVVDSAGSGTVDLGDTDVAIDFSDISGSGSVAASRFDSGPDGTDGIDESNVSDYRLLISAAGGLGPGSNTEVRFPVSDFGGISDPTMVTAYSRSTPGQGTFADLPTSVDESGTPGDPSDDVIVATTGSFSEFVLASDTEPLPVELANFEAVRSGSSVELRWQTASETENSGFRVQRETDRGWQSLGFVESKATGGTTTEEQSYRFAVERELEPGTHRFRLEQVDLDGTTSLSDVVSVEVQMDEALTLSPPAPNPTSGPATVSFAVKEATDAEVVVYNVLGQRVKTLYEGTPRAGQSKRLTIDAGSLPSGVYMVQLRADGQTKTRRLTVVQ